MRKRINDRLEDCEERLNRVDCLLTEIIDSAMRGDDRADNGNAKCFGEILVFANLAKRETAI